MASKISSESKSLTSSLTLNQKLEIIKLSEEDMLKAKIGGKLGFLHQTVSHVVNTKGKSSRGILNYYFSKYMKNKKMKQPYC